MPIKSIKAGTRPTGGGESGDVTLAVANTYQLPQVCANGQVPKWNGTARAGANEAVFTPPFSGTNIVNDVNAFYVKNIANASAGYFRLDNPAITDFALGTQTNGSGIAL